MKAFNPRKAIRYLDLNDNKLFLEVNALLFEWVSSGWLDPIVSYERLCNIEENVYLLIFILIRLRFCGDYFN